MDEEHADAVMPPVVLQSGSPEAVDAYLVDALWHEGPSTLSAATVSYWATLLRRRGIDFVSHASACHYWLYEELSGKPHEQPTDRQN
jgi:hypothetical protein